MFWLPGHQKYYELPPFPSQIRAVGKTMEEAFKNLIRHLFKSCKPTKFVNDPNGGRRRLSKTHRPSPSFTRSRTAGCSPHSITHQELAPRSYPIALYGRHTYLCIGPDLLKCDYEKNPFRPLEQLVLRSVRTKFSFPALGPTSDSGFRSAPSYPNSSPSEMTQRPCEISTSSADPLTGYILCWE